MVMTQSTIRYDYFVCDTALGCLNITNNEQLLAFDSPVLQNRLKLQNKGHHHVSRG